MDSFASIFLVIFTSANFIVDDCRADPFTREKRHHVPGHKFNSTEEANLKVVSDTISYFLKQEGCSVHDVRKFLNHECTGRADSGGSRGTFRIVLNYLEMLPQKEIYVLERKVQYGTIVVTTLSNGVAGGEGDTDFKYMNFIHHLSSSTGELQRQRGSSRVLKYIINNMYEVDSSPYIKRSFDSLIQSTYGSSENGVTYVSYSTHRRNYSDGTVYIQPIPGPNTHHGHEGPGHGSHTISNESQRGGNSQGSSHVHQGYYSENHYSWSSSGSNRRHRGHRGGDHNGDGSGHGPSRGPQGPSGERHTGWFSHEVHGHGASHGPQGPSGEGHNGGSHHEGPGTSHGPQGPSGEGHNGGSHNEGHGASHGPQGPSGEGHNGGSHHEGPGPGASHGPQGPSREGHIGDSHHEGPGHGASHGPQGPSGERHTGSYSEINGQHCYCYPEHS